MSTEEGLPRRIFNRLKSWEGFLLVILVVIIIANSLLEPAYLSIQNQINLFILSIEKIIVVFIITFIIINAEIDLSVASMMGLAACTLAWLYDRGTPVPAALAIGILVGVLGGAFNGFWIARVGLPSLVVTLAMLIGYRGLARVLLEDRSIGNFPDWFDTLGQQALVGPFPMALIIFFVLLVLAVVILQYSGFGRYVYVIGNNRDVARYSGVRVKRVKMTLFIASGAIAALAGFVGHINHPQLAKRDVPGQHHRPCANRHRWHPVDPFSAGPQHRSKYPRGAKSPKISCPRQQ
jgi:rhamnose transport system permease protein